MARTSNEEQCYKFYHLKTYNSANDRRHHDILHHFKWRTMLLIISHENLKFEQRQKTSWHITSIFDVVVLLIGGLIISQPQGLQCSMSSHYATSCTLYGDWSPGQTNLADLPRLTSTIVPSVKADVCNPRITYWPTICALIITQTYWMLPGWQATLWCHMQPAF